MLGLYEVSICTTIVHVLVATIKTANDLIYIVCYSNVVSVVSLLYELAFTVFTKCVWDSDQVR